ncbi:MAG: peptidylprolyl isomerase [Clostridia bacterium]|nr:peptidylprolyl isomerase [Clostridia bacterium]
MNDMEKALKKVEIKELRKMSRDKVVIFGIIAAVIIIAGSIFGYFYYKSNLEAVVTFDGGKVTKAEYSIYYKLFEQVLTYYGYPADQIPEQIANKAGIDKILLMKAKKAGVTLSVDNKAKVDDIFSDKEQIDSFVQKGIDPVKMKQIYYNDYVITQYMQKLQDEASSEDILKYIKTTYGDDADLNEYVTRQILISTTDSSTGAKLADDKIAEKKAKAQDILNKILSGSDIVTLVRENSDDEGTKAKDGEYKVYMDSKTVEPYVNAVKTLKAGETYATLVESDYGFHIIKLEAINANGRTNSASERQDYVSQGIDKYSTDANLKINKEILSKTIEAITGVKQNTTNDTTNSTNNTTNTTTENNATNTAQ